MSKHRMAGQRLDERFGKGFTDRTKAEGTQDPTKRGKEALRETLARFRTSGVKIDEGPGNLRDEYQARVDSGDKFNSRAQEYLERLGITFGGGGGGEKPSGPPETSPVDPEVPTPTPNPNSTPTPDPVTSLFKASVNNTQTQIVNQDNDQTSTINGDGNTVTQNQDNSIRQYGDNISGFLANWMDKYRFDKKL